MKNIFVSSTFRDMQNERDMLNTRVLPGLNKLAEGYGESVMLTDLRWGINTSDLESREADEKILDACLGEIDNCRPYMIVFLGGRYGWIPDESLMRHTVSERCRLELESYDISVTELEIEYGAFYDKGQLSRTLFYFRHDEGDIPDGFCETNPEMQARLAALKEKIKSTPGARVYDYRVVWNKMGEPYGMEELAEQISIDLAELLAEDFDSTSRLLPFELETNVHKKYAERYAERFVREHTNIELAKYILDKKQPLLVVCGSGKTAFLASLACERERSGAAVLPIFAGLTPDSSDGRKICDRIMEFLTSLGADISGEHFGFALDEEELYKKRFCALVAACAELPQKIEIIIDGADSLGYSDIYALPFITECPPENFSLVISASDVGYANGFTPFIRTSARFDYFDAGRVAASMLRGSRKELGDAALREIFRKKDSANPRYLELIMRRLTSMESADFKKIDAIGGGAAAITAYQAQIIRASDGSVDGFLAELAAEAGARIDRELSDLLIKCICAAGYGITETALRGIAEARGFGWSQVKFRLLMQYMDGFFYLDSKGRYRIRHESMLSAVKIEREIFSDVATELLKGSVSSDELYSYLRSVIGAGEYTRLLDLLIAMSDEWGTVARGAAAALRGFTLSVMGESEKNRILDGFADGLIGCMNTHEELKLFYDFISRDFRRAYPSPSATWRHVAFRIFGDWDRVNALDRGSAKEPGLKPVLERYAEKCYALTKEYNEMLSSVPPVARIERAVAPEYRESEIAVGDHRIYFFNVPAEEDSTLFLMMDGIVLLTFHRSSAGDHSTYLLDYDEARGRLTVCEADFCHYDIETLVTTFVFDDVINHPERYSSNYESKRGMFNLPLHFRIR